MSILFRLRSNPACNIEVGPPLSSLLGDSRSVSPEGPSFMAVQGRRLRTVLADARFAWQATPGSGDPAQGYGAGEGGVKAGLEG
jgi:hypothetical protein